MIENESNNELKSNLTAYIEIWNAKFNVKVRTISESTPSEANAITQLKLLNSNISSWTSENDGIVLKTTNGWMRFSAKFLADSLIRLIVEND